MTNVDPEAGDLESSASERPTVADVTKIVFMSGPPKHRLVGRTAGTGTVKTGFPSDANAIRAAPSQNAHQSNPSASTAIPSGMPTKFSRVDEYLTLDDPAGVDIEAVAEDRVSTRVHEEQPLAVGGPIDAVGAEKTLVHRVGLEVWVEAVEVANRSLFSVFERSGPDAAARVDRTVVEAAARSGLLRPGDEARPAAWEVKPVPAAAPSSDDPVAVAAEKDAPDLVAGWCRARRS